MPVFLVAKPVLYAEQSIMLSAQRHSNIMLLITLVNFILNIFQETHDLNFDRLSDYLYLFKDTHREKSPLN